MNGRHHKVTVGHLAREACLYVRQATLREGIESAEILQQQYDVRQQAVALGWTAERVMIIDSDVGQSGLSHLRPGFQKLLRRIKQGHVGIVLALDSSRLTRNCNDWQCLLDACALSDTLLLQQGALFDPSDLHDRVLLGWTETTTPRHAKSFREEKEASA